jgi:FkbM family methyltransferase
MNTRVWPGESIRWYLKHAKHPFKDYLVGHYWHLFERARVWVRYDGTRVINVKLGDYLQRQIFWDGYYERPLVEWLKRALGPADVFWDVGANIGAISLVAAGLCRRVVAFEPDPRSIGELRRNIDANGLSNVEIVPSALGLAAGSATLYQSAGNNTGLTSLVPGRSQAIDERVVRVIRADDFIAEHAGLAPTVMKLDVEGAEHLVLGGAPNLLRSGRLRALIFEDRRDAEARPTNHEVIARLREADYQIVPFGASDTQANDGLYNFLATPATHALKAS